MAALPRTPKRAWVAADHGGYELREYLVRMLREVGDEVIDFGDGQPKVDDDYPDSVVPLARAVARGEADRGVAICGSGVGACVVANKVPGVRACLIHETFSATGVEDDDLNVICLGGLVVNHLVRLGAGQNVHCSRFSERRPSSSSPVQGERHWSTVAVGTALAGHPPHGSQRAELPHWALTSGVDANDQVNA